MVSWVNAKFRTNMLSPSSGLFLQTLVLTYEITQGQNPKQQQHQQKSFVINLRNLF
jgi:hypothetical protein